ncbi:hypothetical protein GQ53DRAFT_754720 [Thozetella sp. PMI_491]|nr:hypothetical protein GQ53DRAFT_754720 [Thozetella sp. PMI_491]
MAPSDLPLILYYYPESPYARRVTWYLALRGIPYTKCIQPRVLPRPDLARLGITYRRIPLLAAGREVYLDTRLILSKLDELFPVTEAHPSLTPQTGDQRALAHLLERLVIDGGVFRWATGSLPLDAPQFQNPKFIADRADLVGAASLSGPTSPFSREVRAAAQPTAVAELRAVMAFLESTLLADGRAWILGTESPSIGDIEAAWPLYWVSLAPGSLPEDSKELFPKVFAWLSRLTEKIETRQKALGELPSITGEVAAALILGSEFAEAERDVDASDPVVAAAQLQKGDAVILWPSDYGSQYKDSGKLVSVTPSDFVIDNQTDAGSVRIHAPRHGFMVQKLST